MRPLRAIVLLTAALLATGLTDAKGGGGRSSGGSARSSGGGSSRSSSSRYVSSGRTTTGGAAVPASCRGCYYGGAGGGFYSRVFIFTYLGTSYRCYSCGSRSYDRYDPEAMAITLATVRGSFVVKLRDQTSSPGATQLTLADVNTTSAMSPAGIAFERSMRSKVVSDWAQWNAAPSQPVATGASLGLADDVAIQVTTAPGSCTGPPPCEPLVTVTFMLLFEDPADASSGRATSHMSLLQASCFGEVECTGCGVPASAADAPADACSSDSACVAACASCADTLGCTDVLPSGVRKGPWDRLSTCTAVAEAPPFTVTSCSVFAAASIQLSSELGEELPYDYDDDGDGGAGMFFLVVIGALVACCVIRALCVCGDQAGSKRERRAPPQFATVAAGQGQQPGMYSHGYGGGGGSGGQGQGPPQYGGPPQMVEAVPVATAQPVVMMEAAPTATATATAVAMPVQQQQQAKRHW
jgi:hypothetical protein